MKCCPFGSGRGVFAKKLKPHPSQGGGVFSLDSPMPMIKINDKDYDTDSLNAEAKALLEMLLATEGDIRRLQA